MKELIQNPGFFAELTLSVILLIYSLRIHRKAGKKDLTLTGAAAVLIVGVFIRGLSPSPERILPFIGLGVMAGVIFWAREYTRQAPRAILWLLVIAGMTGMLVLNLADFVSGSISTGSSIILLLLWAVLAGILLLGALSRETIAPVISRSRLLLLIAPPILWLPTLFWGWEDPMLRELLPAALPILPFALLFTTHRSLEDENRFTQYQLKENLEMIFSIIRNLGNMMISDLQAREINTQILSAAVRSARAESGVLLLVEDAGEKLMKIEASEGDNPLTPELEGVRPVRVQEDEHGTQEHYKIPAGIVAEVLQSGVSRTQRSNSSGDRIFAPLVLSRKVYGLMVIARPIHPGGFTPLDLQHLDSFIQFSSITIQNIQMFLEGHERRRIHSESEISGEIQNMLIPRKFRGDKTIQVVGKLEPAAGVHSDYLDVISGDGQNPSMILCDIAGRGMASSMVMTMIRATFHLIGGSGRNAGSILSWINRAVTRRIRLDRFANMIYLSYNPEKSVLEYAGAAHQPIFVYRLEAGSIERLESSDPPIGIDPRTQYKTRKIHVESGDILLLYTDGVIETRNPQGVQFGYKNLGRSLLANNHLDAQGLCDNLVEELNGFQGKAAQDDDRSIMAVKIR